jgi:hypothetical protein
MARRQPRRGMTLVETLMVVGIISLLVQLLLPAVQAAREAARRVQCDNKLRQLALACQTHVDTQKHFPTGGWTHTWVGEPERGFGRRQPGGWCYNLLPFLEEKPVHELARGTSGADKRARLRTMTETPVAAFVCPSRRAVQAFPFRRDGSLVNADNPDVCGRSDYAANIGDAVPIDQRAAGPKTWEEGLAWDDGSLPEAAWVAARHSGVMFQLSRVAPRHITDGLSKTYLLGEKFLPPEEYESGYSFGDDQALYVGFDRDQSRSTHRLHPPLRDRSAPRVWLKDGDDETVLDWNFGSAHHQSLGMASCDGSVRRVGYDIDAVLHERLGNRADGQIVQAE